MPTGIVKWYDDSKGFGFITDENGEDLFVHFSSLKDPSVKSLNAGELVTFERTQLAQGPAASNVCRVAAAAPTKHHTPAPPQSLVASPQHTAEGGVKGFKCPKCHQVIPYDRCPGCGYTPPMLERHSKEIAWVALAAIVVSAIVIYRTPSVNSSGSSSSTQTVGSSGGSSPTQNMSYMLVEQDKIKSRLKDPDSAEFRNVFVSSKYAVCGEVNAKNSIGGYTGFVRFISGGDMQVVESDMAAGEMDKAWPQICKR